VFFHAVEGFEECLYGLFIRFLGSGKTGLVDAVVDVVVNPVVGLVDLGL